MISQLDIINFKCFIDTKIDGFNNVNLISGLNGIGKTALLEAIWLSQQPSVSTFKKLDKINNRCLPLLNRDFSSYYNIYFNNLNNRKIEIFSEKDKFELNFDYDLSKVTKYKLSNDDIATILTNNNQRHIIGLRHNSDEFIIMNTMLKSEIETSTIGNARDYTYCPFVSNVQINDDIALSGLYDLVSESKHFNQFNVHIHELIKGKCTQSAPHGIPLLKIEYENGDKKLLCECSKSTRKIVEILLLLFSQTSDSVFIDEIENSIHYTNYANLWCILFEASILLDVQIFATTHSLEIINKFAQAGQNNYGHSVTHFEITNVIDENVKKIVAFPSDVHSVLYAIKNNRPLRGEPLNNIFKNY